MEILVSKFIYPKDLACIEKTFSHYKNINLQLAFFSRKDFLFLDHKKIKKVCDDLNINIPTVHAPCVDVFDNQFLEILSLIKKIYNVKVISIHPQRGERTEALKRLKEISFLIKELDLILAYENFPQKLSFRKWICLVQEMYNFFDLDFLKITFDTSHLDNTQEVISEFRKAKDRIQVIHLSDKNNNQTHLPLGEGNLCYQAFLDYLKEIEFKGFLVLEYLNTYENKLIKDYFRLKSV
ncbi:MAG: sugar phosphate isomerase/epimerase [Candidatus Omnitrophica bacterium]|nr:sugar phosphate isomerase/epimerase [Candidatus Omnitrophota bacterium]